MSEEISYTRDSLIKKRFPSILDKFNPQLFLIEYPWFQEPIQNFLPARPNGTEVSFR